MFDLLTETREAIVQTENEIVDFNREQLYEGIRADDTKIEPEYAELTKVIKAAKGQPYDRVTLKDTGDFYAGINVDVNSNSYDLSSTDEKTVKLVTKYGDKIFGLTSKSKETYITQFLKPALEDRITAKLLI